MGNGCNSRNSTQVVHNRVEDQQCPERVREQARKRKTQLFISETTSKVHIDNSQIESPTTSNAQGIIQWKRGHLVGEGAYGKVFQCLCLSTGELLAVKQFLVISIQLGDDPKQIEKEFNSYKREVEVLKQLSHPNVVVYYQTDLSPDLNHIDIVLEYVPGGSLKDIIQKYHTLDEILIRRFTYQLLLGLAYLHRNGIAHRDLKSANVLVTLNGQVKLTDFGSSKRFDLIELGLTKSLKGSPYWMAPEVVLRQGHNFPADIWSLGGVLIEMATGYPPWYNYSRETKEVLKLIATPDKLPDFPQGSETFVDFISKCLQRDPEQRATAEELLRHDFVQDYNDMPPEMPTKELLNKRMKSKQEI